MYFYYRSIFTSMVSVLVRQSTDFLRKNALKIFSPVSCKSDFKVQRFTKFYSKTKSSACQQLATANSEIIGFFYFVTSVLHMVFFSMVLSVELILWYVRVVWRTSTHRNQWEISP